MYLQICERSQYLKHTELQFNSKLTKLVYSHILMFYLKEKIDGPLRTSVHVIFTRRLSKTENLKPGNLDFLNSKRNGKSNAVDFAFHIDYCWRIF